VHHVAVVSGQDRDRPGGRGGQQTGTERVERDRGGRREQQVGGQLRDAFAEQRDGTRGGQPSAAQHADGDERFEAGGRAGRQRERNERDSVRRPRFLVRRRRVDAGGRGQERGPADGHRDDVQANGRGAAGRQQVRDGRHDQAAGRVRGGQLKRRDRAPRGGHGRGERRVRQVADRVRRRHGQKPGGRAVTAEQSSSDGGHVSSRVAAAVLQRGRRTFRRRRRRRRRRHDGRVVLVRIRRPLVDRRLRGRRRQPQTFVRRFVCQRARQHVQQYSGHDQNRSSAMTITIIILDNHVTSTRKHNVSETSPWRVGLFASSRAQTTCSSQHFVETNPHGWVPESVFGGSREVFLNYIYI